MAVILTADSLRIAASGTADTNDLEKSLLSAVSVRAYQRYSQ